MQSMTRFAAACLAAIFILLPQVAVAQTDSLSIYQGQRRILWVTGADFLSSSAFIGNGGASLEHTAGNEGYYNVGTGIRSLTNIRRGSYNTFGGYESGEEVYDNNYNTGWGEATQIYNKFGNGNTSIGWKAGLGVQTIGLGDYNSVGGYASLIAPQSAVGNNTAWGAFSLGGGSYNASGNLAIGYQAGYDLTTGGPNVFLNNGPNGITTGGGNLVIGNCAGMPAGLTNNVVICDGAGNKRVQYDPTTGWTFTPSLPGGSSVPSSINGYATGRYQGFDTMNPGSGSTQALAANTIYYVPIRVRDTATVVRLGLKVTTAAAGKSARLGLYNSANQVPTSLILDAGTVSVAATGVVEITLSHAIAPGVYWLAVVSDGTPTVMASPLTVEGMSMIGTDTAGGTENLVLQAFTFGALPASAGTITYSTGNTPVVLART